MPRKHVRLWNNDKIIQKVKNKNTENNKTNKKLKLNKDKAKRKKEIKQQRLKNAGTVQNHQCFGGKCC